MTALSFFIGGIIAYGVLSLYWKERSVRYKLISGGIFCLLIFISAFVASAYNMAAVWYVAGSIPILIAFLATFVSLLIMPYSLPEATANFQVPDYLHSVDQSEFMTVTFDGLPNANHKGEALYTLLRVLYVVTSSRKKAHALFPQVIKTAVSLYDAGSYTPNSVFFFCIRGEITDRISSNEIRHQTKAIDCAVNLIYESILSAHKSGELTPQMP